MGSLFPPKLLPGVGWGRGASSLPNSSLGLCGEQGASSLPNSSLGWRKWGGAPRVIAAAEAAGRVIQEIRESGFDVEQKGSEGPVTQADRAADALLRAELLAI